MSDRSEQTPASSDDVETSASPEAHAAESQATSAPGPSSSNGSGNKDDAPPEVSAREARRMHRYWSKLLRKSQKKLSEDARRQVQKRLNALRDVLDAKDQQQVQLAFVEAERMVERHLQLKSAAREFTESIVLAILFALFLRAFVVEAFKIPTRSMVPTLLEGDHLFVNKFSYGIRIPFTTERLISFSDPERGDVVVFVFPRDEARQHLDERQARGESTTCFDRRSLNEDKDYIKRIIGLPGETIEVINHVIHINGEPIPRTVLYRRDVPAGGPFTGPHIGVWAEERIGSLRYVTISQEGILGDNVNANFGPITVKPGHIFVMGDNRDNSSDSRCWGQVPVENIKGEAMIIWWSSAENSGIRWDRFFTIIE